MKGEFRKLSQSFRAAWCGVLHVVRHERNFRIHITVMGYVLLFALLGRVSSAQFAALAMCFGIVLSTELFNTAIELLCDRIDPHYDKLLGRIKDLAAAAVLVSALMAAVAGLAIFLSKAVLSSVLETLYCAPYLLVLLVCTIPLALLFIFRFGKKQ